MKTHIALYAIAIACAGCSCMIQATKSMSHPIAEQTKKPSQDKTEQKLDKKYIVQNTMLA